MIYFYVRFWQFSSSPRHLVQCHWGLAFVLMLRPFFPELVMSTVLLFCFWLCMSRTWLLHWMYAWIVRDIMNLHLHITEALQNLKIISFRENVKLTLQINSCKTLWLNINYCLNNIHSFMFTTRVLFSGMQTGCCTFHCVIFLFLNHELFNL